MDDPLKRRIERGLYRLLAEPEKRDRWKNPSVTPKNEEQIKRRKELREELRENITLAMNYLKVRDRKWGKDDKPKTPNWGAGFKNGHDKEEIDDGTEHADD